jgi:hypothetical protein
MSRQRRLHSAPLAVAVMLVLASSPAWALAQTYQGEFDPCPFTPASRADVAGIGTFTASLDGATLTISGTFSELAAPATAAHLRMGLAMGVPGGVIGDLEVAHETAGSVKGTIRLSPEQVAALRRNAIYIQIDDTKAPTGAIWAWIITSP